MVNHRVDASHGESPSRIARSEELSRSRLVPSRNPAGDSRTLLNICEATRLICVPNSARGPVWPAERLCRGTAFRAIVAPLSWVPEAMSLKTSAHVGARGTPGAQEGAGQAR